MKGLSSRLVVAEQPQKCRLQHWESIVNNAEITGFGARWGLGQQGAHSREPMVF